jgi:hypothetical protein
MKYTSLSKICFFLFFFIFLRATAVKSAVKRDSLLTILKIKEPNARERNLIVFLRYYFGDMPEAHLEAAKTEIDRILDKNHIADRAAFNYFIEAICQMRLMHFQNAEYPLIKAIRLAVKNDDHYLLYACFTHLGFLQTYQGNTVEAISSFRLAKKEATVLDDPYLLAAFDINLSEIYVRNSMYSQSLYYLNQAQSLINRLHINEQRLENVINNNKAEVYFRINSPDSLKKYHQILNDTKDGAGVYTFKKRTDYYVEMLQPNYTKVIATIRALQKDSLYRFDALDEQNLADAYFQSGRIDSAKVIINRLLEGRTQNNHPEIRIYLYEALGQIAERENDKMSAIYHFKKALGMAKEQSKRLTQIDTIASQIKIDEMQSAYIRKAESYKRERIMLILMVTVLVLTVTIGTLLYNNIKRKNYYEKLLFATKKKELAFINSHEIRRHLSNIIGIVDTIKQSETKYQEYLQAEPHLLTAAENLDTAIKNISAKLDD